MQRVLERLQKVTPYVPPVASQLVVQKFGRDPFLLLIFCLLSLRTKDSVAFVAACRLFERAKNPAALSELDYELIQKLIFPVGFYRKKARTLIVVSQIILKKYAGIVPTTYSDLIDLPGIGPKTAHLVLAEGFGIPAICVDTHVHRVSNRLGLVKTKAVEQTQIELEKIISKDQWISINRVLVAWGQTICKPISPLCLQCPLQDICPKNQVVKSR